MQGSWTNVEFNFPVSRTGRYLEGGKNWCAQTSWQYPPETSKNLTHVCFSELVFPLSPILAYSSGHPAVIMPCTLHYNHLFPWLFSSLDWTSWKWESCLMHLFIAKAQHSDSQILGRPTEEQGKECGLWSQRDLFSRLSRPHLYMWEALLQGYCKQ